MKKIVSFQVPKAKTSLPLFASGVLLALAAGEVKAEDGGFIQGDINSSATSSPLQTIISGDQGCVTGAHNAQHQQTQPPQQRCHYVGAYLTCN
jgi:hypothetical protein